MDPTNAGRYGLNYIRQARDLRQALDHRGSLDSVKDEIVAAIDRMIEIGRERGSAGAISMWQTDREYVVRALHGVRQ